MAIKVDREERPDLDDLYLTAVQMMTGSGGWPMSVFVTPDGRPFFGGTYFPRDQLAELLRKVHTAWRDPEQRKQIDQVAQRLGAAIGEAAARAPQPGAISPAVFRPALRQYLSTLDPQYGGFESEGHPVPKFPQPLRLGLMLAEYRRSRGRTKKPDPRLLHAVTVTLDGMARGGLYDQVGGGFHRYSTDGKWLVPHFEKMLYDQALLSWVYLEAYRETRNPDYRRVASETLDFALRELHDPNGGFWSTLDADSPGPSGEKEEGRFYTWKPAEVAAALGPTDGGLFNRIYGITSTGNFEGRCIPNLVTRPVEAWARELKLPPVRLRARLDRLRARLRDAREKRPHPPLDDQVLASWNGLMLRSLALGYDLTGEERYRRAAEKAAGFLLTGMRTGDGRLLHSYRAGATAPPSRVPGFLEDYSFAAVGLLELHRATGEERWLKAAQSLAQAMVSDFWDEQAGTFYATPRGHQTPIARLKSAEDNATPSGSSMAALALLRLARITGDRELRVKAQRVLDTYASQMERYPAAMPNMLLAAEAYFTADTDSPAGPAGPVAIAVTSVPASVRPGQTFEVAVRLKIRSGWHIQAAHPADPALVATKIAPAAGAFRLLSARYPEAGTLRLGFSKAAVRVYSGEVPVRLKLQAPQDPAAAPPLRLRVQYQACSDRVCQRPSQTLVSLALKVERTSAQR